MTEDLQKWADDARTVADLIDTPRGVQGVRPEWIAKRLRDAAGFADTLRQSPSRETCAPTCATCRFKSSQHDGYGQLMCEQPDMVGAGASSVFYRPPPQPFGCTLHEPSPERKEP
jgi:hypothetical protein